jgi:recombination protein RecA
MALKFYASLRLDVRRIQSIKAGAEVVGSRTRVRVVKNKVAPPFREAEFDIMYNEGISKEGDLIDIGTQMGLIAKRGAFFSFGETRIGQGRENAKQYLKEHPDLGAQIEQTIREQILSNREAMKFTASSEDEGKVEEEGS